MEKDDTPIDVSGHVCPEVKLHNVNTQCLELFNANDALKAYL